MHQQKKFKWMHMLLFPLFHHSNESCERRSHRDGGAWNSFHHFASKGQHAPAGQRSKIQACFGAVEDFWIDAKVQNMLKNKDSLLHNSVTVSVIIIVLRFKKLINC